MPLPHTDSFLRLPRLWRDKILSLERAVAEYERRLCELTGVQETSVEIDPYRNKPQRRFLSEYGVIRYTLPGGEIDVRLIDSTLHMVGYAAGDADMVLLPRASNRLQVRFK